MHPEPCIMSLSEELNNNEIVANEKDRQDFVEEWGLSLTEAGRPADKCKLPYTGMLGSLIAD